MSIFNDTLDLIMINLKKPINKINDTKTHPKQPRKSTF